MEINKIIFLSNAAGLAYFKSRKAKRITRNYATSNKPFIEMTKNMHLHISLEQNTSDHFQIYPIQLI